MVFVVNADVEINGALNQYGESGEEAEGSITNSAGENVIPKSDGTNLVPSILSELGGSVIAGGSVLPEAAGTRGLGSATVPFVGIHIGSAAVQRTLLQSVANTLRTASLPNATGTLAMANATENALPRRSSTAGVFADSRILDNGTDIIITGLPTSNPGVLGALWNDGGILKISAG